MGTFLCNQSQGKGLPLACDSHQPHLFDMSKCRILIIEDLQSEAEELSEFLLDNNYEITAVADNLRDALGYFYSQKPDMVLADIYLGGKPEGITFAERMQENPNTARPLIFLTSHTDQHTYQQAKLTLPFSYLLKPYNQLELQFAMELAMEKFANSAGSFTQFQQQSILIDRDFYVKRGNSLLKVKASEIEYAEVEGKYSNLITADYRYMVQQSLKNLEEKFMDLFIRIHRNYLVNIHHIHSLNLSDGTVSLKTSKTIPLSQNFKEQLLSRLDIIK